MNGGLETTVNEIADGVFRFSTWIPGITEHGYMFRCAGSPSPTLRPHNWESGLWFDETTSTLLCGDVVEHAGQVPARTGSDCVVPALAAEEQFQAIGRTPNLAPTLEQLAQLRALPDGLAAP